jgi:hypothetical protein
LGGEAPAPEIFSDAANVQFDAESLLNELTHSSPAPKEEIHLELLRSLVNDDALDAAFLGLAQGMPNS